MASVDVPYTQPIVSPSPGIPALFQQGIAPTPIAAVLTDTAIISGVAGQSQWGIFGTDGTPILEADSVASLEYAQDFRISDYPQEASATTAGTFESYNKVQLPYQAKVGFLIAQTRDEFLNSIGAQLASLTLVTVVSPEVRYANANLTHYGYRRTSKAGVTMILVEVWCEEVRITATTQLSNATQSQNGHKPQQGGTVQPDQTTAQPTNPVTGQPQPGLPSSPNQTPSTSLPQPNTPSTFYSSDNLPRVPNAVAGLTDSQQNTAVTYSLQQGGTLANLYSPPPDTDGVAIEAIDIAPQAP
jgi:hypothetical protein